jgi:dihydropteroate synthase
VVEALAGRAQVSVDTVKAAVARAAAAAGARLINDVSGTLWPVAAECGVGWVAMHRQGTPADMQSDPRYDDVVAEVRDHLLDLVGRARGAGVEEVWVDPGIGFGKTVAHNLALLAHLGDLVDAAHEAGARGVLVGTSNKWFLGVLGSGSDAPLPADDRSEGTLASSTWAMSQGVEMVRVHDVVAGAQAARLVGAPPRRAALEGATG